jgi:hypothetical protein
MRRPLFVVLIIGLTLLLTACPKPEDKKLVPEPPPAPSGLTATAGNGSVILNWSAASGDGVASYNIYQGTTSGNLTKAGSVAADALTYTALSLSNGTEYFFAVDAETTGGKLSAKSNEVSATPSATALGAPTIVIITPEDGSTGVGIDSNINVTFSRAMNQAATEAAFTVNPDANCDFSWSDAGTRLTCSPASGLSPDTSYTVTISTDAEDQAGVRLVAARSVAFTTGNTTAAICVFDATEFGSCVFAP